MKKIAWTFACMALLGALPAVAQQQQQGHEEHRRRPPQIVQGTIQNVNGPLVVLQIPTPQPPPGTNPYGYPSGQTLQIDTSAAAFEGPDGSPMDPQALFPGEHVIIAVRPAPANANAPVGNAYGYAAPPNAAPPYVTPPDGSAPYAAAPPYGPPPDGAAPYAPQPYGNPQYQQPAPGPYNQVYAAPLRATLVEPLAF